MSGVPVGFVGKHLGLWPTYNKDIVEEHPFSKYIQCLWEHYKFFLLSEEMYLRENHKINHLVNFMVNSEDILFTFTFSCCFFPTQPYLSLSTNHRPEYITALAQGHWHHAWQSIVRMALFGQCRFHRVQDTFTYFTLLYLIRCCRL